jgi:hypothetical protein
VHWQLPKDTSTVVTLKQRPHQQYGTPRFDMIPPQCRSDGLHWPHRDGLKWPHPPSGFLSFFLYRIVRPTQSIRPSSAPFAFGEPVLEAPGFGPGLDDVRPVGEAVDDRLRQPRVGD